MRAHAKTVGDWLKALFFLVDAVPAAPPPGLVDKWTVCRIHQPNNAVIYAAREVSREVRQDILLAEGGNARHCRWIIADGSLSSGGSHSRFRHIDPEKSVTLLAGEGS